MLYYLKLSSYNIPYIHQNKFFIHENLMAVNLKFYGAINILVKLEQDIDITIAF